MAEPFPREGLPLEEARCRVLAAITPLQGTERLPLGLCLGRVSAEPVMAAEAVPGFRASIMDGYAIADADAPSHGRRWRLVGRSAPGAPYAAVLAAGEAIRILTGAPLPEGARRVLPQELVRPESVREAAAADDLLLTGEVGPNPWIRAAEEEAAAGDELLPSGVRLGP
ncbi:molybdopterin molybdenumtransferase MoeA, partial [Cyanobium gracile UHCC 0281]|nr:molybdopterin molybdenumtransferase MoeA [Cyanobium gracile UHCC 0281]